MPGKVRTLDTSQRSEPQRQKEKSGLRKYFDSFVWYYVLMLVVDALLLIFAILPQTSNLYVTQLTISNIVGIVIIDVFLSLLTAVVVKWLVDYVKHNEDIQNKLAMGLVGLLIMLAIIGVALLLWWATTLL